MAVKMLNFKSCRRVCNPKHLIAIAETLVSEIQLKFVITRLNLLNSVADDV